jgi:hypothetical protein
VPFPRGLVNSTTVSSVGELRLYAIGIQELHGIVGAAPERVPELRELARRAFAPTKEPEPAGLLSKLGPIFRRVPAAPVIPATQPEPRDVEILLAGAYVPPERIGATWRVLETLAQAMAWGSTRMSVTAAELDDLDFALARGGVSAAFGLRHLLSCTTSINLIPVSGLTVGWQRNDRALAMAGAYRSALPQIEIEEQRETISSLATWLDGFVHWSKLSGTLGRPVPDLVGFWAN